MLIKTLRNLLIIILISLIYAPLSSAQEKQNQTSPQIEEFSLPQVELAPSGITPDHSFYFLKIWKESIILFFTFGSNNKIERRLQFTEVRLAEYKKMLEIKNQDLAQKCLDRYQNQLKAALKKLEKLKSQGKNPESLAQDVLQITLKHIQTLQAILLEETPDQSNKGLSDALTTCQQAYTQALEMTQESEK